jgi:PAS domain S-box-containing protein
VTVDRVILAALEHSPDSVSIYALDGTVVFVNAATERILGVTLDTIRGKRMWDLYPEAVGNAFHTAFLAAAATGEQQRFEANVPPFDGCYRSTVDRVDDHIIVHARDVGDDVRRERRLLELERASTSRLQGLLEVTGRLAGVQRPEDVARELVDGGANVLSTESAILWERAADDVRVVRQHGSDAPPALHDVVKTCLRTLRPVWRPSSATLPLGTDACLMFEFAPGHELAEDERMYLEILASHGAEALRRAQAMTELHDASELQAAVIDASPIAVMLVDADGLVRSWSRGAERIFGWTAAQTIGRRPQILGGDESTFESNTHRVITGQQLVRMDIRRQRANGNLVDVELYAAPLRRSSGEMLALFMMVDITERKTIERARLQMVDEAQRARAEAEAANRSKDEFLAMLGHELRNPLAPMVTALELMNMKDGGSMSRERAVIGRQVQHLSRLVDDLLDVSRITRGKIELRRERVTLADVVAKAVEQTSPLFDERRHRLTVDVPPELAVHGDPTRLAQVVSNLMTNAAKYTPHDGLIEVIARAVDGRIRLTVRDNGIGIPPSILPHVFDLFVQAPQSSERPAGGLGLGLTIVKSLVGLHGGTVSASSEGPGRGSELVVELPADDVTAVATTSEQSGRTVSASARRILVVDDNEDAAMMLADVLDAYGHDARTAFDGPSALRIADEFQPEIAVLDIGLPVMDGYELAERLRQQPALHDVRLIAVTGYGQESDRRRSLEAGFHAHLAKPVEIEALVGLVEGR